MIEYPSMHNPLWKRLRWVWRYHRHGGYREQWWKSKVWPL